MSAEPYRQYKDSGVQWLGQVPAHWLVSPLKYLADFKSGGTPDKSNRAFWDGDVPWASAKDLKAAELFDTVDHLTSTAIEVGAASLIDPGAVLVVVRGMILARTLPIARTRVPMAINQDLKAVVAKNGVSQDYLAWLLEGSAQETLSRLDEAAHGTKALRMETWTAMQVPLPPLQEQKHISKFLVTQTAKIDSLIEEQQRLIDLLKEKRQAVVSKAISKGLIPGVPMKDSGVEWLGKVPAHWKPMPIRLAARLESGHTPSRSRPEWWVDCTVPWFTLADVWQIRTGGADIVYETKEMVSELGLANSSARLLPKGTVMLSRTASVGFSAIMGVDMATTQDFANWVCGEALLPEFLLCVFRSMSGEFRRLMMGSTHNTIYMPDIQALRFALPSIDEQRAIVAHVRQTTDAFDALTREAQRGVDLLLERRSALISAAVTGKVDVRGLARKSEGAAA